MIELAVVALALLFVGWREHEHAKERRHLLNRIQAPEVVVAEEGLHPAPAHVPFDDDEAFHEAVAERN